MKDHALLAKFVGFWAMEKDLIWWIKHYWKPKGGYVLWLGAKGFFTVIFYSLEDKNQVFKEGSYFYNSSRLYLTFWKEWFNPDKEDLSIAPVWLQLYSLPCELCQLEILTDIGKPLGVFVKVVHQMKRMRNVSYAHIYVYLDISNDLPTNIKLSWHDEDWIQDIDYKHIPFCYRRCHEHGHLF